MSNIIGGHSWISSRTKLLGSHKVGAYTTHNRTLLAKTADTSDNSALILPHGSSCTVYIATCNAA